MTEAAQARLTRISGARDDFDWTGYQPEQRAVRQDGARRWMAVPARGSFRAPETLAGPTLQHDLDVVLTRLSATGITQACCICLTRHELGIPVVRVVVPDLEGPWTPPGGEYTPGVPCGGRYMKAVVFLGPTLTVQDAAALLDADYLPAARQGDVYRVVRDRRPAAIGLVDGVFKQAPVVWHREILWALTRGVHVFGAASMGALRAAELEEFGMRGVGRIFESYRDGSWPGFDFPFEDDDEVAVIHAPAEANFIPLSDAMVDLRDTLLAAEANGVLTRVERDALADAMKRQHYPDRSLAAMATAAGGPAGAWIAAHPVRRKRLDAEAMLLAMADFLATDPPTFRPAFRFTPALVWQSFVAAADAHDTAAMSRAVWRDWLPDETNQ